MLQSLNFVASQQTESRILLLLFPRLSQRQPGAGPQGSGPLFFWASAFGLGAAGEAKVFLSISKRRPAQVWSALFPAGGPYVKSTRNR